MKALRGIVFFGVIVGFTPASLNAQDTGRVVGGNGIVELYRNGAWIGVSLNEQVRQGEKLRTGVGAFATIEFAPNAAVTLADNSEVELRQGKPFLTSGMMQVISMRPFEIVEIGAGRSRIESVEYPLEMVITLRNGPIPEVNVMNGAIRFGVNPDTAIIVRSAQSSSVRTLTSGARNRSDRQQQQFMPYPYIFVYPQVTPMPVTGYPPPLRPNVRPRD